jgi:hypothetical protein
MTSNLLLMLLLLFAAPAFSAECTAYEKLHPRYPLTGAHLSTGKCTSCGTCHINSIWTGTPRTCIACHNGDPSRMTVGRSAKHLPTLLLDCGGCHVTTSFLTGTTHTKNHTTAASLRCDSCHNGAYTTYGARGKSRDHPTRYTIGGVSVLVATVDCGYCHTINDWNPKK